MMKEQILNSLKEEVLLEKEKLEKVYATTKNLVQNGDLKSDGKHDTRATEVNYLADGQRQRLSELEQDLQLLDDIDIKSQRNTVSIGTLAEIEFNGQIRKYFIAPTAGGKMVKVGDEVILVISVFSPIGDAALSLEVGDDFEVELAGGARSYLIRKIG